VSGRVLCKRILAAILGPAGRFVHGRILQTRARLAHVATTVRLARGHWGLMSGFIALALVNAVTDGFSVMLLVPLLQSFSSVAVFAGVPILQDLGALLQPLDPLTRLRWVAIALLVVILLKGAAQYGLDVIVYVIPQRVERGLRMRAFQAMMLSRLAFSEGISAGELGNLTASFPARAGIAARFLSQMVAAGLTVMMLLILFVAITPAALLGLAAFAIGASVLFRALTGKLSRRLDSESTVANEAFAQAYFEAVNNKRTIRVFNATDAFLARITQLLEHLRKIQSQTILVQNATYPFFATLAGCLVCGTALIASFYQPDRAQALLGFMLVFLVAAYRTLGPFSVLHIARMHYAIHADAVSRLDAFLADAERNRDRDGAVALARADNRIEFRGVTFRYAPERAIVRELSFSVEPGEFVALVGRSGAGKSTVFSLLTRLHRPEAGAITVGGIDLDDLQIRTWWDRLSLVSQDVPIFNASVTENILFGTEQGIDRRRLDEALALSAADGFVAHLSEGLETRLGEFGSLLSGGERQRLALARAFYHRRPVILLDEATSQLDARNESRVTAALARLKRDGHTILAIAHHFSTIRQADRIIVLDDGSCVATGRHDELLATCALYRELSQAIVGADAAPGVATAG